MTQDDVSRSRVAVFGGAFNPPHLAHVFAVNYLLGRRDVDQVWLMPTADHVFGKDMAPLSERIEMLKDIVQSLGWVHRVHISDFEGTRTGPSRTFETLTALSERHPDLTFSWVIGSDNLTESHRWYRFEDIVSRWSMIVMERPGHQDALRERQDEAWCSPGPCLPAISSTQLRKALRGQGDPALLRWIPDAIRERVANLYPPTSSSQTRSAYVFGYGRMGQTWTQTLRRCGWSVTVWNRSAHPDADVSGELPVDLAADVWLLTVHDDAVEHLANTLAQRDFDINPVVLHCAGRLGSDVLSTLADRGLSVGSLHPLQSVRGGDFDLAGAWLCVSGDEEARSLGTVLTTLADGHVLELPCDDKASYHAAAVVAANFITTLGAAGIQLMASGTGVSAEEARVALNPLMAKTVEHLRIAQPNDALTGPFARYDLNAIRAHIDALERLAPEWLITYAALAQSTAHMLGWSKEQRDALLQMLPSGTL